MAINSNAKGKRGEREVVNLINRSLGTNFRRTPNSGGLSFKGDVIDINVDNPLYDFHIEIKNTKTLQIPVWMKQVHRDIPLGKRPLLIAKYDHKYHTFLELRDFLHLVKTNMELMEQINELTEQLKNEHN